MGGEGPRARVVFEGQTGGGEEDPQPPALQGDHIQDDYSKVAGSRHRVRGGRPARKPGQGGKGKGVHAVLAALALASVPALLLGLRRAEGAHTRYMKGLLERVRRLKRKAERVEAVDMKAIEAAAAKALEVEVDTSKLTMRVPDIDELVDQCMQDLDESQDSIENVDSID